MTTLRVIFMGTAPLAAVSLRALARWPDCSLLAAVTQPDRPKGRELKLQPSPVKTAALGLGLPVLQPEKARQPGFLEELRALDPHLIVVAAYGQILPPAILDLPRFRCVNVHASLLPRYRGAAPIQWALLNGESRTGVTIMLMEPTLDTGPILALEGIPISDQDDAPSLHDRLAALGADLLVRTLVGYVSGTIQPVPQPAEGVSYARKITREDGRLDWSLPARVLWNRVRGLIPWPGAFSFLGAPGPAGPIKIWRAEPLEQDGKRTPGEILQADKDGLVVACGDGALRVLGLQREGGKRLGAGEFLAGHPLHPGQRFHSQPAP